MKYEPNQVGAVIVFKKEVSKAEAAKALRQLNDLIQDAQVEQFDNRFGTPVFYIP